MVKLLEVSRSGFYKWLKKTPSKREVEDSKLKPIIKDAHEKGRKTCGTVKIQQELKESGVPVGRDRIHRLKKEMGLRSVQKKKFIATTNSNHKYPVAPNLLKQKFNISEPGAIHHSDRGVQYCSKKYVKAVKDAGFELSMSRRGNCFDNAPTESFWGALKQEFVYQNRFKTRLEAEAAIQEWIEVFYNRIRRHSYLGNVAPAVWADRKLNLKEAA